MQQDDCLVVLVTVGSREDAGRIATSLVCEHLAACVNIVAAVESVYWWEGRVHHDAEVLLIIKTRAAQWSTLERRVRALHSYQNPEVIALPITAGSQAYLDWVRGSTGTAD